MNILITGAASGIGRATALAFLQNAKLRGEPKPKFLLVDLNQGLLNDSVNLLGDAVEAVTATEDLGDPAASQRLVSLAGERLGGVDVIVSNAGVLGASSLEDLLVEDYDRAFAVNTRATWLLGQAALPFMKKTGGLL